jgi:methylenetetrahydrofolate dehydrogenase (NADP+)/methenyltetrahydrofolate cyclohydrolase
MARQILGAQLAQALSQQLHQKCKSLQSCGIDPKLVIVRFGEQPGDIAYERGIVKTFQPIGIRVETVSLPPEAQLEELLCVIDRLSRDNTVHGILPMRPFPPHIDDTTARNAIPPEKDMDGVCDASLTGLFTGMQTGYAPCTAQACMALLEQENVQLDGCRATVVGRSLVIGKPVGMLLLQKNATVTYAHSRTRDLPSVTRDADVLIVAAGKRGLIGKEHVSPNQVVLDVGMHYDENGKLTGDVCFDEVFDIVSAVTPARGGVGSVTTCILASHVVASAEKCLS